MTDLNQLITASLTTLFDQSKFCTESYLLSACRMVDKQFGKGYSKKHPELIGRLVVAQQLGCELSIVALKIQELSDAVERQDASNAISEVAEAIKQMTP